MAIPDAEKNNIWLEVEQKSPEILDVFLSIDNKEEARAFFRDIFSERDLREIVMRWEVAKKLDAGVPFSQIQEETGQSPVTITKINRWLTEGCGGYKLMIEKMKKDKQN